MQNNLQAANATVVQQPNPNLTLVPQEWGTTFSGVSALLSILAFLLSGSALWNTRKASRQSSFDNHYGDSIRTGLRELEDSCGRLRAFSFPSTRKLAELKNEVPGVQSDIEERCFKIGNLVREVDAAKKVRCEAWCSTFTKASAAAGLKLESATNPSVETEIEFRKRVEDARDLYRELIGTARQTLESVRNRA